MGLPLAGVETRLGDEDGAGSARRGDHGKLQVRGPTLFDGYLNRPDATAEAFDADGWYRAGDVAVIDDGGMHRIVGRESVDLIKSGGYRIGAGEMETALLGHPGVNEVAVVGLPDEDLGQRIVAFVVGSVEADDLIGCRRTAFGPQAAARGAARGFAAAQRDGQGGQEAAAFRRVNVSHRICDTACCQRFWQSANANLRIASWCGIPGEPCGDGAGPSWGHADATGGDRLPGRLGDRVLRLSHLRHGGRAGVSRLFFPHLSTAVATIASMGTFGAAFLSRPVGAAVFGYFGDHLGRKKSLVATLLIMALSTVSVGLVPSTSSIGVAAPLILVALRLLQGFAVGGHWAGSALLSAEYAPAGKRGRYGMFIHLGGGTALVLNGLTFLVVNFTIGEDSSAFMQWGWRLPFLISAGLIFIALYVWLRIDETPIFAEEKARDLVLMRRSPRCFACSVGRSPWPAAACWGRLRSSTWPAPI